MIPGKTREATRRTSDFLRPGVNRHSIRHQGGQELPKNNLFKIGVAVAAAGVGAILAITSVFAHATPTTSGHSIVGSIVRADVAASFPFFTADTAPNALTTEQTNDAEEAADENTGDPDRMRGDVRLPASSASTA